MEISNAQIMHVPVSTQQMEVKATSQDELKK